MNYEFRQSPLSRAVLTGLFAGIVATMICLVYNIAFREGTKFPLSDIINVSSIIFGINILFVLFGALYYALLNRFQKNANLIFIVVVLLIALFAGWKAEGVHRSDNPIFNAEFRRLLLGVVIISGLCSLLIPFLFRNKKFEEHVV